MTRIGPIQVADSALEPEHWLETRAQGVTATDVHALARGGASTRQRILSDKLNGSTFTGNRHTRRGHDREPILADWIERKFGIAPNSALWAEHFGSPYLATPDGFGTVHPAFGGGSAGSEVKSHDHGFKVPASIVPADHFDQCQWGMKVTGVPRWLYVWEILGDDGYPPLEPDWIWIDRDDARIADLTDAADRFLEWRAAGAPLVDTDIDSELDEAISRHVAARRRKDAALADEKVAEATVRAIIKAHPTAATQGLKASGNDGQLSYSVRPKPALDWAAWTAAHPVAAEQHRTAIDRLARFTAAITAAHGDGKTTSTLSITAHKKETA